MSAFEHSSLRKTAGSIPMNDASEPNETPTHKDTRLITFHLSPLAPLQTWTYTGRHSLA